MTQSGQPEIAEAAGHRGNSGDAAMAFGFGARFEL